LPHDSRGDKRGISGFRAEISKKAEAK